MQHQQGQQQQQQQQQHQAPQGPWPTPNWLQRPPQQTAWMPVAPPAVQYSSSWGDGPSVALQPFNGGGAGGSHPWSAPQQPCHQRQQHQFGSQPTAGHWGVQLRGHAAGQPLSTSVPAWGAGHPAASPNQHFKAEPVPLMYDFSAHQAMAPAPGQLPLPSPTHGTAHGVAASQQQQQRAHTAPPRRTSARLPSRIDYSVFAGEATSDSEDRRSDSSARSSPVVTSPGGSRDHGAFGGSSDSPADSGGSPAGYGPPLQHQGSGPMRPASYSAGGAGHFGGRPGTTPPRNSRAGFGGSPKSLPTGGGFLKSRSGRTVRPSGHRLRDSSPEGFPLDGGRERERERSAGGAAGGPGLALLGRPGSGTLSKRKRLVQPPAALRDGADADFNQRRKQHNPWCASLSC